MTLKDIEALPWTYADSSNVARWAFPHDPLCGTLISGEDTYDPMCELLEGHAGHCKSTAAIGQHHIDESPVRGTLYVEFKSGGIYSYASVPLGVVDGLQEADSVGSYLNHYIKGTYEATRVQVEEA